MSLKWAVVQSLAGGQPLGFGNVLGPPSFIVNNDWENNTHYENYINVTKEHNIPVVAMNEIYTEFTKGADVFEEHKKNVEIVSFTPACSGLCMLSTATTSENNKMRGDPGNDQNLNMISLSKFILSEIKPKVAVMENAPALMTKMGMPMLKVLTDIAKDNGYSVSVEKTDTFLHGIPQHRQRTFVYFWSTKTAPLIKYENITPKILSDYLEEIPEDSTLQDVYFSRLDASDHFTYEYAMEEVRTTEKNIAEVFKKHVNRPSVTGMILAERLGFDRAINWATRKLKNTEKGTKDFIKYTKAVHVFNHAKNKKAQGKSYWDSSVIVCGNGLFTNAIIGKNAHSIVHPTKERSLNIRELMWLMGFPNDFELLDAVKNKHHLTQNVPVKTSSHVATQCKLFIEGKLEMSNSFLVKQSNTHQRIEYESNDTKVIDDWLQDEMIA